MNKNVGVSLPNATPPVKLFIGGRSGVVLFKCLLHSHNDKIRNKIVLAEPHSFHLILKVSFIKPNFTLFVLAFIGTSS